MSIDERNPMDSVNRPEPDLVVSPELVLVDPDLARLARERLSDAPHPQPSPRVRVLQAEVTAPPEQIGSLPRRRAVAARAVGAFATAIPALLLGAVAVGMVASEVQAQLLDDPIAQVAQTGEVATPPASAPSASGRRRAASSSDEALARPRPTQAPSAARPALPPRTSLPALPPAAAVPARPPTKAAPVRRAKPTATRPAGGGSWIPTRSEVEARTLVQLQERVALWVPAELLDKKANLLVDNVPGLLHPGGADAAVRLPARNRARRPGKRVAPHGRRREGRLPEAHLARSRGAALTRGRGGKPRPPVKKRRRRPALRNFDGTRVVGRCTSPPLDWAAQGACYTAQTIFSCWTKWARGAHFL